MYIYRLVLVDVCAPNRLYTIFLYKYLLILFGSEELTRVGLNVMILVVDAAFKLIIPSCKVWGLYIPMLDSLIVIILHWVLVDWEKTGVNCFGKVRD